MYVSMYQIKTMKGIFAINGNKIKLIQEVEYVIEVNSDLKFNQDSAQNWDGVLHN